MASVSQNAIEPDGHVPVVAVGCSAGGIEALLGLFPPLPDDLGVAYVVVSHLDPDRPSDLATILRRACSMPVAEASSSTPLRPDHVYVAAPGNQLVVEEDRLENLAFEAPRGQRRPIDRFFVSLANRPGDEAYAIVLSGSGSDGAIGARAIKESGGVVLVQDPHDAEFPSMPRSVIATGLADFVLPVGRIAALLPDLVRSRQDLSERNDSEDHAIRSILALLRAGSGHDFSRYKRATILRRLTRRMQLLRIETAAAYLAHLRESAEEAQSLFSELLISVTSFFRDPAAFDLIARKVIPPIFASKGPSDPVRIWVPGCASGEEAYSVGILFLEEAAKRKLQPEIQIFATDLDNGALATAREGRYPTAIEADVAPERLERFFRKEGEHYRVCKELRDLFVFASHSVLRDPPFSRLDFISCRNLLIYLDRTLQAQVCNTFHYALVPGGYLFLGTAENVETARGRFRAIDRASSIYQATGYVDHPPRLPAAVMTTPDTAEPVTERMPQHIGPGETAMHLRALEETAPPSILVDEDHKVLHLSESAGRFIEPSGGPLSPTVTQLARPELRPDLRATLHEVFDTNEPTLSPPIDVAFDGTMHQVYLHVRPTSRAGQAGRLALVFFIDTGLSLTSLSGAPRPQEGNEAMVARLQQELLATRERLAITRQEYESTNEDLRAANEELQSINEEYRSTAEELETSREELQSVNEELQTLNAELKNKLEGVSRAHSDLQNFISATDVGTLFLDGNLRINRFTPQVANLFAITAADSGRPISDFAHKLVYDELENDARRVLAGTDDFEREIQSKTERWYLVRMRPYRTLDERVDGVVITFVDVTDRRSSQHRLLTLTAELDHRVKNALARAMVVVDKSRVDAKSIDDLADKIKRRLRSMSETHALLSRANWSGVNLHEILSAELAPYARGDDVSISGEDMVLDPDAAQAISIVIHELTTNAVKHGSLSQAGGSVACEVTRVRVNDRSKLRIRWTESGGPPVEEPQSRGYGLHIVEHLPRYEISADVEIEFAPLGLRCTLTIPMDSLKPREEGIVS